MPKPLSANQFSPGKSSPGRRRFLKAAAVAMPMVRARSRPSARHRHNAQDYPSQPIRLVVAAWRRRRHGRLQPPGGGADCGESRRQHRGRQRNRRRHRHRRPGGRAQRSGRLQPPVYPRRASDLLGHGRQPDGSGQPDPDRSARFRDPGRRRAGRQPHDVGQGLLRMRSPTAATPSSASAPAPATTSPSSRC